MGKFVGEYSLNMVKAKNEIFEWMDDVYKHVGDGRKHPHLEISTIYAFLSGRHPSAYMEDCFILVQDVCEMCTLSSSVYPYPDGEWWTEEETKKYLEWKRRSEHELS